MGDKVLDTALKVVGEAIKLDQEKKYEEAYPKYKTALNYFLHVIKFEKNETKRDILARKAGEYMSRLEQLEKVLMEPSEPAAAGGGAAVAGEGKEDSGDAEKTKLRGALSGAIITEKPNVKWDDVAGLEGAKDALKEAVILPARFPKLFTGKRRPWKGILLYGPPGTGKSYLAKAVATEADSTFFSVSSSDLVSKWQGESERLVRSLFEMAREAKPAIIFIDEIDSLCSSRGEGENDSTRRIKTEFLVQMQGVGKTHDGILVLGATNIPWDIDSAMRRRFEKRIYIPLPEEEARFVMFKIHMGDTPSNMRDEDYRELARRTEGFSGSDVSVAVRGALMNPVRRCQVAKFFRKTPRNTFVPVTEDPPCPRCPMDLTTAPRPKGSECESCHAVKMSLMDVPGDLLEVPPVSAADFMDIIGKTKPSVGPEDLERFVKWTAEFGEEGS